MKGFSNGRTSNSIPCDIDIVLHLSHICVSSCVFMFVTPISQKKTYINKPYKFSNNLNSLEQRSLNNNPSSSKKYRFNLHHLQTPRDHGGFLELTKTSWWFLSNPLEKYHIVKLENISPGFRGEHNKYLGATPKMVGFPNNHGVFLLKMTILGWRLGVPPFKETSI